MSSYVLQLLGRVPYTNFRSIPLLERMDLNQVFCNGQTSWFLITLILTINFSCQHEGCLRAF